MSPTPNNESNPGTEDRATKLSALYPQPSADGRSYLRHGSSSGTSTVADDARPLFSWPTLLLCGSALSLPLILLDVGLSVFFATDSRTEVAQLAMFVVLFLVIAALVIRLTRKIFIDTLRASLAHVHPIYWMAYIFSLPAAFSVRWLLSGGEGFHTFPSLVAAATYYLMAIVIFALSTTVIAYLMEQKSKGEIAIVFTALPYIIGLLAALIKL